MSTAPVTPDAGAAVATPTPTAPAAPVSQPSAPPTTPGQPAQDSGNIAQLRTAYDGLKSKYEPWEKLNLKPDQVQGYQTGYTEVRREIEGLARQLGFEQHGEIGQQIDEAVQAHGLLPVLRWLENQAWQREQANEGNPDVLEQQRLDEMIESRAQEVLGPIQQRENVRMTNEANSLFERTVHQLATDLFKQQGIDYSGLSEDEKFFISSGVSEVLKYDQAGLQALKFEGKTASVQKAFQEFVNMWDKAYLARSGRERARVIPPNRGGTPPPPNANGARKPTLDEMIENPSVIDEAAGRDPRTGHYR